MIILNNKRWLIVIAVILVGIFAVMLMDNTQKPSSDKIGDSISDIVDSADDGAEEFREELIDEIDDNTTDAR
ncbi:MAG: hypothetical protein PHX61_02865 [Alphaproteobacteria bacterium]|nr:hypothetical protein [Alphaproteobacteria bacterium]